MVIMPGHLETITSLCLAVSNNTQATITIFMPIVNTIFHRLFKPWMQVTRKTRTSPEQLQSTHVNNGLAVLHTALKENTWLKLFSVLTVHLNSLQPNVGVISPACYLDGVLRKKTSGKPTYHLSTISSSEHPSV